MRKRILSIALAIVTVFSILPFNAFAAELASGETAEEYTFVETGSEYLTDAASSGTDNQMSDGKSGDGDGEGDLSSAPVKLTQVFEDEITVTAAGAPDGAVLNVSAPDFDAYDSAVQNAVGGDYLEVMALDISVSAADGAALTEPVTISVEYENFRQLPDGTALYHVKGGAAEQVQYTLDAENAAISFSTQDFSPFVLAAPADPDNLPDAGLQAENSIVFVPVSPINQYDVQINGEGEVITIYCLQQTEHWPKGDENVHYVDHNSADPDKYKYVNLLSPEEMEIIRRLVYVGYPINARGYLNPIQDMFYEYVQGIDGAEDWVNNTLGDLTNAAIWDLMTEWGKAGSDPEQVLDYSNPSGGLDVKVLIDMLLFAKGSENIEAPTTPTILIEGSGHLTKSNDGKWTTGDLKITHPIGYNLTFDLTLPEGVRAMNEDGEEITAVMENQVFRITADSPDGIDGTTLEAKSLAKYPTDINFFVSNDTPPGAGNAAAYQTMLYIQEASMELVGTLELTTADVGGLSVSKTITGEGADMTKAFSFTVELSDKTVNGPRGEMIFKDGVTTFSLTHNETITALDLPVGISYTVTEEDYTAENYSASSENASGTIAKDVIAESAFTNTYKEAGIEEIEPITVSFGGTKSFTGMPEGSTIDPQFTFILKDAEGTAIGTKTLDKQGGGFTFDEITFEEEGSFEYTVIEIPGSEAYIKYDDTEYTVIVDVSKTDRGQLDAEISVNGEKADGLIIDTLNFENKYEAVGTSVTLGGTKTLNDFPTDSEVVPRFTFTLNENGTEIDSKTVEKQGTYTFNTIEYSEVGTHTYIVAEKSGRQPGITYASNTYTVVVDVTDNNGQLTAAIKVNNSPVSGSAVSSLNFTNSYEAETVEVSLSGKKTLEGKDLADKEFSFTLSGSGTSETVQNDADGNIEFSPLSFDKVGTYTYTVKEEASDEAGIVIDGKEYTVTVTVSDDGSGKLKTVLSGDTTTGTDINFTNTFKSGSLAISKVVAGELGDKNKLFTFTVTFDVDGTYSYTGSKSGTISSGDTVQLKHGESITISGIPEGTEYSVEESDNTGYKVYKTGDEGTIAADKTASASFTNTRSRVPNTGDSRHLALWLGIMLISLVGAVGTIVFDNRKRRRYER